MMQKNAPKDGDDDPVTGKVKHLISKTLFREADEVLKRQSSGRAMLPAEQHEFVRIALLTGDYDGVYRRLAAVKADGSDLVLEGLHLEALIRDRKFESALLKIETLRSRIGSHVNLDNAERLVLSIRNFEERIDAANPDRRDYKVYCINLDEQVQKWERAVRVASRVGLSLERVPGVRGSHIPDGILPRLGTNVQPGFKGTLGCFLSHYKAWEQFLSSGMGHALILEDDFIPRAFLPSNFLANGLPETFDLCWLNDRMSMPLCRDFSFVPVNVVVASRASAEWVATGGDAYFLSRNGAAKLVSRVDEDGFYGDVDWRMLTYSLSETEIARLPVETYARWAMEAHRRVVRPRPPLSAFAASLGLFKTISAGSIREDMNTGQHPHVGIVKRIDPLS